MYCSHHIYQDRLALANSVDPDQMLHSENAASDQVLHCLLVIQECQANQKIIKMFKF